VIMARRAEKQAESLAFDPELAELPPEARWREWMNRVEAVLFAAPQHRSLNRGHSRKPAGQAL